MANFKYLFLCMYIWSYVCSVEVNTESEPSSGSNGLEATLQGPSTVPSSGSNGLSQVLQGPGAALSLLLDIRDLLAGWSSPPPRQDEAAATAWRPALEDHRKTTDQTLDLLNDSVERVSSGVTQKVGLIMESFSALKMLVEAQETQIRRLQGIVEKVQGKTDNLDDQYRDFRLSLGALQTRFTTQDPKGPADLSEDIIKPDEFNSRWLFIDDVNANKTDDIIKSSENSDNIKSSENSDNIKSSEKSEEESSTEKDLKTCLHYVKNEVASLKVQIQNIDISTTTPGNRDANLVYHQSSNPAAAGLENIVNNLERIQTKQQVSLEAVNYKVAMIDNLSMKVANIDNVTSFYSYKMSEMQDTINNVKTMKVDIGSIKNSVADVGHNVRIVMFNVTELNKDVEQMETKMNSLNITTTDVKKGLCVHPYRRGSDSCFYVHTSNRLGWRQARDHCRTIQGDLAAPGNYTTFKTYLLAQRLTRSYTYWLGASDTGEEGVWKWVDGRKVDMGTAVWQSGQPNEGTQANCMEVKPAYKYVAADVTCKAQNYFICEQER